MGDPSDRQDAAGSFDPATRIPIVVLDKPRFGQPCNGCGLCCIEEVCSLGRKLGDDKVCRALIGPVEGRYSCGLMVDPYRFLPDEKLEPWRLIDELQPGAGEQGLKDSYRQILASGKGCDSSD